MPNSIALLDTLSFKDRRIMHIGHELRKRAENLLGVDQDATDQTPVEDVRRLVHELTVHQIELELQNDELQRVQSELEASRDRFSSLYDFAPVGYVTLSHKGQIEEANLTATSLFKCSRAQLIGRYFSSLISPDSADEFYLNGRKASRTETPQTSELQLRDSSGDRWVRIDTVAQQPTTDEPGMLRISVVDISEEVKAKAERAALDAKLEASERFNVLGAISGGVAHDFNNLLTPIIAHASIASESCEQSERSAEIGAHLNSIIRAALMGSALCAELLHQAGGSEVEQQPLALSHVVRESVAMFQPIIPERIKIKIDCPDELPTIQGATVQLNRVVVNLLKNASEAVGEQRGQISISTGVATLSETEFLELRHQGEFASGQFVYLLITDDGCGMSEETMARVFEPFFTSKFKGRGLGMASVMGIANTHNAALDLQSNRDDGTSIRILFPAIPKTTDSKVIESRDANGPATPKESVDARILVIDDDSLVLVAITALLQSSGYTVATAACGTDGIQLFRETSPTIDLVILDLTMPDMDGFGVHQRLQEIDSSVPVILCSGHTDQDVLDRIHRLDLVDFVRKPEGLIDLPAKVSHALLSKKRAG